MLAAGASALLALLGVTASGLARGPFRRVNPKIKGVSLSSYSLRDRMRWRRGEKTSASLDLATFIDYAARTGFDGVELTSYFFRAPLEWKELSQLRRHAHIVGLEITSGAMGNDFSWQPTSTRGKEHLEYVRTWIDAFADLGAPAIRVFGSRNRPPGQSVKELKQNVVENLALVLRHAERRGVMLGLENHGVLVNTTILNEIVKSVDSPWLGICWDSGNLPAVSDPYIELTKIAPSAVMAQIKHAIPVNGVPTAPDFTSLVRILREADYAGYLVLEYEGSTDPHQAIPKVLDSLRSAISETA